jgi:hypothetical protein
MAKWTPRPIRAPILPPDDRTLKFSLKYLDIEHSRFRFDHCSADDFLRDLVLAMKHYSQFTLDQFTDQNHDPHRHQFDFAGTPESEGFSTLEDELRGETPWQFPVCPDTHTPPQAGWRVYGVILEDTFYVVWLDTKHQLFPDGKFRQD